MSKFLNILKFILLILLLFVNILAYKSPMSMLGWNHILYLILIGVFILLSIKDIRKKDVISNNKMYNFLCIIVFIIMNIVFLRALYDPRFLYNNSKLIEELNSYSYELYGDVFTYEDQMLPTFYIAQNINYFLAMFGLIFIYRFLNKSKDIKKTTEAVQ